MINSRGGQNKLHVFAIVALIFLIAWLILTLFQPQMHYRVKASSAPLDSQEFWWMLESVTDARLQQHNKIQVLPNGENFYKAELATIAQAQHSVNIEAYIFQKGEVAQKFIDALTERARNGVKVKLVIDALGSFSNSKEYFK